MPEIAKIDTVKVEILAGIIFGDFRPKTGSLEFKLANWPILCVKCIAKIYWREFNLVFYFISEIIQIKFPANISAFTVL